SYVFSLPSTTDTYTLSLHDALPISLAHQLEPVVVDGIVRGSHLDAAVHPQMEGRKIHLFRADHAQVQHVHPLIAQTVGQGRLQGRRAFTDVPAQNHFFGLQPLGKTPGDAVGDAFVQLRAQLAADVIRLEAGDSRHKRSLF